MSNTGMIRVGVEIRTNELRAVAIDQDGQLAATRSIAFDPAEETAQQVKSLIGGLKKDVGDFDRLGVAVPGLVDQGTHRVAFSAHISEQSNFDLIKEISSATGLIASIENDANRPRTANLFSVRLAALTTSFTQRLAKASAGRLSSAARSGAGRQDLRVTKFELAMTGILTEKLKVRVSGGINLPGVQNFSVTGIYFFGD